MHYNFNFFIVALQLLLCVARLLSYRVNNLRFLLKLELFVALAPSGEIRAMKNHTATKSKNFEIPRIAHHDNIFLNLPLPINAVLFTMLLNSSFYATAST